MPQHNIDDDDILGPLAKPVSEFAPPPPRRPERPASTPVSEIPTISADDEVLDRPLAELVDMGFPVEDAREALASTQSGTDVQAAVGWLLNRAHAEAQRKAEAKRTRGARQENDMRDSREPSADRGPRRPREAGTPTCHPSRSQTPSHEKSQPEKDPAQMAAEFGNTLFKSANSLWKTSTKRVQQAVQEFNAPADASQPRWMRNETLSYEEKKVHVSEKSGKARNTVPAVTDEALMLESRPPPSSVKSNRSSPVPSQSGSQRVQDRSRSPALFPAQAASRFPGSELNGMHGKSRDNSASRLGRLTADEEASQAYISPARRRKAAAPQAVSESQPNLLEPSTFSEPKRPASTSRLDKQPPARQSTPLQVRSKAPPRSIPPIQPSAVQASTQHRLKGSEAFKRGDYSAAHVSYSNALSMIPDSHPIAIVLLTNRALTALKIGEP
jgi:hypothetical protein